MLRDKRLELADDLGVAAECQESIDALLERRQVELFEPRNLAPGEWLEGEVGERRTTPEGEGLAELRLGCGRIAVGGRLLCIGPQTLEAVELELMPCQIERVPRRPRDEKRPSLRVQELAQARDIDLHRLAGGLRRLVAPQRVDETVGGDGFVGVQEEDG